MRRAWSKEVEAFKLLNTAKSKEIKAVNKELLVFDN